MYQGARAVQRDENTNYIGVEVAKFCRANCPFFAVDETKTVDYADGMECHAEVHRKCKYLNICKNAVESDRP